MKHWIATLAAVALVTLTCGTSTADDFIRGDADGSGDFNLVDPIITFNFLIGGEPQGLPCNDAADSNDDGTINVVDIVYTLLFLFQGGPAPEPPYPNCGPDPTDTDPLDCANYPCP